MTMARSRVPANRIATVKPMFDSLSGGAADAAKELIGTKLVRVSESGETVTLRIIETEAYHESEPGSHAYRGKTARNNVMFERAGIAYVYFIYGMYHCLNVTAEKEGTGAAVLLRAAEIDVSSAGAGRRILPEEFLHIGERAFSGPGKLCRALTITRAQNGLNLLDSGNGQIWLREKATGDVPVILSSKRIGLSAGGDLLWRFFEADNPRVSRSRA